MLGGLPQPMHGWRAFAGEVGTIVLGVLVALGLGAAADDFKWYLEVQSARAQIRDELSFNFALLGSAEKEVSCVQQHLDRVGAIMAEASKTHRLPPVAVLGGASTSYWPRGIWESQVAAQTMVHYPANEAAGLNRVYRRFQAVADADRIRNEAWATLSMLIGPGRRLDEDSEGQIYAALARARWSNFDFSGLALSTRSVLAQTLGKDYPKSAGLRPIMDGDASCELPERAAPATYGSLRR